MTTDTRVLPQLRMTSTRVLPQRLVSVHDRRCVHYVVTVAVLRRVRMTVDARAAETTDAQVHMIADARVQS